MSWQNNKLLLHSFVTLPVAAIVIAAFTLSAAGVVENLRFINSANQILSLVTMVKSLIAQQGSFAQTPGDDIWVDLAQAGQVDPDAPHQNGWHGDVRATVTSSAAMRVENDVPTHDCRRLALYFISHDPAGLGLTGIEAQSYGGAGWTPIYPPPQPHGKAAEIACGTGVNARLALIFKIR